MGERIGIIAGSGAFVGQALSELRRRGFSCAVVGVEGETAQELESRVETFQWVKPGEIVKALSFLQNQGVREVMMLGKIRPGHVFNRERFDAAAKLLWEKAERRSSADVVRLVISFLEENGLRVRSPFSLFESFFMPPGALTAPPPSASLREDMDFGLRIAKRLADWEVGQTVIVKDRVVVAVEGLEGTDQAILRGGELAGPGIVAVKAGRTEQDMRIDIPAVGLETIKTIIRAGGAGLGIESMKVAFFEREEALALAEAHGVSVAVREV